MIVDSNIGKIALAAMAIIALVPVTNADAAATIPALAGESVQLVHMDQDRDRGQWREHGYSGRHGYRHGMSPHRRSPHRMMEQRRRGSGMMRRGTTDPDMERRGMMVPGILGHDRMGRSMTVTPNMDLSVDDVRHFLRHHLDWLGNKRLKIGEVKEIDDDSILADIVTTEGTLVDRFEIDRHSGQMDRID